MTIVYGILCLVSFALLIICLNTKKHDSIWLKLLFLSIFIYCVGNLIVSMSCVKWLALVGNSVAYLGSVCLPMFALMLMLDFGNIHLNIKIIIGLFFVACLVFVLAISPAFSKVFYFNVSLKVLSGGTVLIKEYGVLHILYAIYLLLYFCSMLALVIYLLIKPQSIEARRHSVFVLCVLIGNLGIWATEKFIDTNFEFLTLSYILTESLLLLLYSITYEYNEKLKNAQPKLDTINSNVMLMKNGFSDEEVLNIFDNWQYVLLLTEKEKEILTLLLKNEKRKNMASLLFVSENTIKKHTASIFKKLQVASREELFNKANNYKKARE